MAPEHSTANSSNNAAYKPKSTVTLSTNLKCPFKLGDVVWARLTNRSVWWPAIVIDPKSCGYELNERIWVLWFGDQRLSDVELCQMKYIYEDFNVCYRCRGSPSYHHSVQVALELFFEQLGLVCPSNPVTEALIGWSPSLKEDIKRALGKNVHKQLPGFVEERLLEILRQGEREGTDYDDDDDEDDTDDLDALGRPRPSGRHKGSKSDLSELSVCRKRCRDPDQATRQCLICCSTNGLLDHPFFLGKICESCQKRYKEVYFVVDDDGKKEFCSMCGCTGSMVICDNVECSNVFCKACIVAFASTALHESILATDPWQCFLCTGDKLGLIGGRSDWKKCLFALFNAANVNDEIDLSRVPAERKPIRVLSLFDGLATGKVILDLLRLEIDTYYCCEIDPDALLVSRVNHPKNVVFLGDVRHLSFAKLEEISPIDLLIGGSPCNDVSIANPKRRGLYDPEGTGILFFEYYRVLQNLLLINAKEKRNLFWLFENVASMRECYKSVIDRFLGRPPALYDSRFFSAQNRARYFWGNIPGMYKANVAMDEDKAPVLDDILTQNCGRKSKMAKVRTITTRSNSLKQGRTFSLCPVEMDGRPDILWPTEIERLFGFPDHYTDVGGLPPSKRQKLIGQGWTIPVVKHIMRPLQKFFKRVD